MQTIRFFSYIIVIIFLAAGCLTVEKKEYKVNLNSDGSGMMTITYVNIVSKAETEDDGGAVDVDFDMLISSYVEGDKIAEDYPNVKNIKKRLFEEDGVLNAEVSFEFDKIQDIKLYGYDEKSLYMIFCGGFGETYNSSNGKHGGQDMPIIFWEQGRRELQWSTFVQADLTGTKSLLQKYKEWESKQ